MQPRKIEDIEVTQKAESISATTKDSTPTKKESPQKGSYVLATLAAVAIVSGGLMVQYFGKKN